MARPMIRAPRIAPLTMDISADSKEELDETVDDHKLDGWRETSRTVARDGTYHAKLTKGR